MYISRYSFFFVSVIIFCGIPSNTLLAYDVNSKKDGNSYALIGNNECKCERGEKGEKGDPGPRGEKGEKGDQSSRGEKGENGEKGEQGPRGEKGEKGEKGEQSLRGEKGEKGEKGDLGPRGEKGEKGEKGDLGPRGEKGEKGEKGDQGLRGEKGEKGEKGDSYEQKEIDFIINNIKEMNSIIKKNVMNFENILGKVRDHSLELRKVEKINYEQTDHIYKNTMTSEKNERNIFRIEALNKIRDQKIRDHNEKLNKQLKNIQTKELEVTSSTKTGSLILKNVSMKNRDITDFDVSGITVIFADGTATIKGFSNGIMGQILYVINTGEKELIFESGYKLSKQMFIFSTKKIVVGANKGVTMIFDGHFWRIMNY